MSGHLGSHLQDSADANRWRIAVARYLEAGGGIDRLPATDFDPGFIYLFDDLLAGPTLLGSRPRTDFDSQPDSVDQDFSRTSIHNHSSGLLIWGMTGLSSDRLVIAGHRHVVVNKRVISD